FDSTLGALLVGGLAATALWGVTCVQTFTFFMRETKDHPVHKALVNFMALGLDTFDTVLNCHILYFYLVRNYLDPTALIIPVWWDIFPFELSLLAVSIDVRSRSVLPSVLVRSWTAVSNGNIPVTGLILALSTLDFAACAFDLDLSLCRFGIESFLDLDRLSVLMYLNFAAGTSSDLSVALALCHLLRRSRTGFRRTDSLIRVLMMYTVNTGLIVAIDATAGMLAYAFMPHNFIFLGFYLLLSKLYLNSYLAILNARKGLRGNMDEPKSIRLSRMHSTVQWRHDYDQESQGNASLPALSASKGGGDDTVGMEISLDSNRIVEKGGDYAKTPSAVIMAY
ncbi:hypothetical protein B0H10DRAFT_1986780, partial [Mycena sp. CBHHK59/15]